MLQLLRQFHKQIGDNGIVTAAGVDAPDDVCQNVPALLGERISLLCLLCIDLQQILLENLPGKYRLQFMESLLCHIWFPACRVCHDMHMGMMALVMERRIPPQVGQRDFHRCCHSVSLAAEQIPPCGTFVISQPYSIFPPQGQDFGKHHALVVCYLFGRSGEIDGDAVIGEQTVRSMTLHAGTLRNIFHIVFPFSNQIDTFLNRTGDEFRSCTGCAGFFIVLIFKAVFGVGIIRKDLCDQFSLRLCHRAVLPRVIEFFHAFTLGDIPNKIFRVPAGRTCFEIPPLENNSRHRLHSILKFHGVLQPDGPVQAFDFLHAQTAQA